MAREERSHDHQTGHDASAALATGLSVLVAESHGITTLHEVYSHDPIAIKGFENAISTLLKTISLNGSIIVSGVGKSGLIGRKIVATFNSLGLRSFWLHPTEALHGDLGMIGPRDTLLLITFSGSTAELLSLVCHLPPTAPLILMSSARPDQGAPISSIPLFAARVDAPEGSNILLQTPIPVSEKTLFGISAPTVSTTVTLALGDALAMAAAHRLHEHCDGVKEVFHKYHPGGAIGRAAVSELQVETSPGEISPSDASMASPHASSLEGSTIGDDSDTALETLLKASEPSYARSEGALQGSSPATRFLTLTS